MIPSKKVYSYRNGNYLVTLTSAGSKTYRSLVAGEDFKPIFPDSLDIKITDKCSRGCPYCHEGSNSRGWDCDLDKLKIVLNTLPKQVPIELAFGGGNLMEYPIQNLTSLFNWCKDRGYVIGMTLNFSDFLEFCTNKNYNVLRQSGQISSIGISIDNTAIDKSRVLDDMMSMKNIYTHYCYGINIVYHLVLGTFDIDFLDKFFNQFSINKANYSRVIFLGYKNFGRGEKWENKPSREYFEKIRKYLIREKLRNLTKNSWIISFDNLAIEQLRIKDSMTTSQWESFYMGNDFSHSMYIDAVTEKFAPSSTIKFEDRVNWSDYNNDIIKYFKNNHNEHDNQ